MSHTYVEEKPHQSVSYLTWFGDSELIQAIEMRVLYRVGLFPLERERWNDGSMLATETAPSVDRTVMDVFELPLAVEATKFGQQLVGCHFNFF